jgi:hypothetical protein
MKPALLALTAVLAAGWRQAPPPPPGLAAGLPPPPVIKLAALSARQRGEARVEAGREVAGVHRRLPPSALNKGKWIRLADGGRLWRVAIRSAGARGVRVHFQQFAAGKGHVWLQGTGKDPEVDGPFTGTGLYENGDFWSGVIGGEAVVVEYLPEPGSSAGVPPFRIPEIAHLFR